MAETMFFIVIINFGVLMTGLVLITAFFDKKLDEKKWLCLGIGIILILPSVFLFYNFIFQKQPVVIQTAPGTKLINSPITEKR